MNNKKLGTDFENKIVDKFTALGYWVHFLNPDNQGAQPFDIIAIKGDRILAIDCKTCKSKTFTIERLEENQKSAFKAITKKTTAEALVIIEHDDHIFVIPYEAIKRLGKINLFNGALYSYCDLERELNETKIIGNYDFIRNDISDDSASKI